jgi:rhodanese-related sulfurtransferase
MKPLFTAVAGLGLALALSGGALADVSPTTVEGATTIDTAKAKELFDAGVAFVDVRKDSDWDAGRIPGAIHLELKKAYNADSLGSEVKKEEPVVLYCNGETCLRSSEASAMAVGWGWSNVHYYRDGFPAWKSASLPVE